MFCYGFRSDRIGIDEIPYHIPEPVPTQIHRSFSKSIPTIPLNEYLDHKFASFFTTLVMIYVKDDNYVPAVLVFTEEWEEKCMTDFPQVLKDRDEFIWVFGAGKFDHLKWNSSTNSLYQEHVVSGAGIGSASGTTATAGIFVHERVADKVYGVTVSHLFDDANDNDTVYQPSLGELHERHKYITARHPFLKKYIPRLRNPVAKRKAQDKLSEIESISDLETDIDCKVGILLQREEVLVHYGSRRCM